MRYTIKTVLHGRQFTLNQAPEKLLLQLALLYRLRHDCHAFLLVSENGSTQERWTAQSPDLGFGDWAIGVANQDGTRLFLEQSFLSREAALDALFKLEQRILPEYLPVWAWNLFLCGERQEWLLPPG